MTSSARALLISLVTSWCITMSIAAPPAMARDIDARADVDARRLVLVIARNDGGADRPTLRFAHSDAEAFARVLTDIGGVPVDNVTLVLEPDGATLRAALDRFAALAEGPGRVEAIVYYSGHSDAAGLILGNETVSYSELKAGIARVRADVRVVILDSCASGAFVREKGVQRRPAFLVDEALGVTGTAVLTSSSADESAQESDRLRGSFFTHALVTGLRGAADDSADGRVTLTEAYQYAFRDTLARTERTTSGPQHAAFDIRLAGTGDYIMTDLRETSSSLVLDAPLAGRVFVRDEAGHLVAELKKTAGVAVALAVGRGSYDVTVQGADVRRGRVEIKDGRALLTANDLVLASVERTRARGVAIDEPATATTTTTATMTTTNTSASPAFIGGVAALAVGGVATIGLGAWSLALHANGVDPEGDARSKQLALDAGPVLLGGTVSGAVLVLIGAGAVWLSLPPE